MTKEKIDALTLNLIRKGIAPCALLVGSTHLSAIRDILPPDKRPNITLHTINSLGYSLSIHFIASEPHDFIKVLGENIL